MVLCVYGLKDCGACGVVREIARLRPVWSEIARELVDWTRDPFEKWVGNLDSLEEMQRGARVVEGSHSCRP